MKYWDKDLNSKFAIQTKQKMCLLNWDTHQQICRPKLKALGMCIIPILSHTIARCHARPCPYQELIQLIRFWKNRQYWYVYVALCSQQVFVLFIDDLCCWWFPLWLLVALRRSQALPREDMAEVVVAWDSFQHLRSVHHPKGTISDTRTRIWKHESNALHVFLFFGGLRIAKSLPSMIADDCRCKCGI